MKIRKIKYLFIAAMVTGGLFFCAMAACAREVFVNNVDGDDIWDGSRDKPFRTVERAVKELQTSDSLHLTPTGIPYSREKNIEIRVGGTLEKPLVIDGHGSEITGFRHYGPEVWTDEGDGVFSMPLGSNSWMREGYWEGFNLVFFDGKPGKSCRLRAELVPYGYVWFSSRLHDKSKADAQLGTLYIMLPEGKTPAEVRLETAGHGGNLSIVTSHVVVRNLISSWSIFDGFSSGFSKGLVYENVEARYNMDQGMSHHSSVVVVRNSHFHNNAGGGIVDIRMNPQSPAESVYENCLIENDTYRGGVEFHDGIYKMKNCIIRNNTGDAVLIVNNPSISPEGTKAVFENCLVEGGGAIAIRGGCGAEFINCTFYKRGERSFSGQGIIFAGNLSEDKSYKIFQCAFIDSPQIFNVRKIAPEIDFKVKYNYYGDGGVITVDNVRYSIPGDWDKYREASGLDAGSFHNVYKFEQPPYAISELKGKGKDGADIGAQINLEMFSKYRDIIDCKK